MATAPRIAQAQFPCPPVTASQETVCNLAEALDLDVAIGITTGAGLRRESANAFTTGDATDGYILRSVRINLWSSIDEFVFGAPGDISVAIHAQAGGGPADDPVENGRLSGANPTGGGTHDFTARNVVLARNATYFLVVSAPDAPNDGNDNGYSIGYTESISQTGSSGWSIGDRFYLKEGNGIFQEFPGIVGYAQHFAIVANIIGIIASADALAIDEAGVNNKGQYTLVLGNMPSTNVTITPSASPDYQLSPPMLIFTDANWDTPSTITVTAVDDDIDNPRDQRTATITHAVTGASEYVDLASDSLPQIALTIADDDDAPALRLKLRVFLESALP